MNINKQCIVIFPVYRSLSDCEKASFEQAIDMTPGYKHVFIAPQSFEVDNSFDGRLQSVDILKFDDRFFSNIQGYNHLMLSLDFYKSFVEYEYMLIHQSDAYLFKPELEAWCNKGFSYIGAPWFWPQIIPETTLMHWLIRIFPHRYPPKLRKMFWLQNEVGNGGLSLRRISHFIKVLEDCPPQLLNEYNTVEEPDFNEDVFWAYDAPKILKDFKKPTWRQALHFGFEIYPKKAYKRIGRKLPFGCHGYDKNDPDFWKQFIPSLNK